MGRTSSFASWAWESCCRAEPACAARGVAGTDLAVPAPATGMAVLVAAMAPVPVDPAAREPAVGQASAAATAVAVREQAAALVLVATAAAAQVREAMALEAMAVAVRVSAAAELARVVRVRERARLEPGRERRHRASPAAWRFGTSGQRWLAPVSVPGWAAARNGSAAARPRDAGRWTPQSPDAGAVAVACAAGSSEPARAAPEGPIRALLPAASQ